MLARSKCIYRLFNNRQTVSLSRFEIVSSRYSINTSNSTDTFTFNSHFTEEEQLKILHILNDSKPDQLCRYSVSQARIKNIENWKTKKGPFKSLGQVLEVDGLGEKVLQKICANIILQNVNETKAPVTQIGTNRKLKQLVTPVIPADIILTLKSAVGIHLSPIGISWAKLNQSQNRICCWDFQHFTSLPKKMLPTDTFNLAIEIVRKLPASDVYIFEGHTALSIQGPTQSAAVSSNMQQVELTSMLLALLNTSMKHNLSLLNPTKDEMQPKDIENRVFQLRAKVPARLFRTLVGSERVEGITTVTKLLNNNVGENKAFPCTPVHVEPQLKSDFLLQSPPNKELLGQALMLVVSFMDLCVYKTPVSLSGIAYNNKK